MMVGGSALQRATLIVQAQPFDKIVHFDIAPHPEDHIAGVTDIHRQLLKTIFSTAMRKAAQLTQNHDVIEATRVIQRALTGRNHTLSPFQQPPQNLRLIEPKTGARPRESELPRTVAENASAGLQDSRPKQKQVLAERVKRPLGEVLTLLRQSNRPSIAPSGKPLWESPIPPSVPVPEGAAFLARFFSCAAGSRDYKVYVPGHAHGRERSFAYNASRLHPRPRRFRVG
jgi:hypothetical protein